MRMFGPVIVPPRISTSRAFSATILVLIVMAAALALVRHAPTQDDARHSSVGASTAPGSAADRSGATVAGRRTARLRHGTGVSAEPGGVQ